MKKYFHKPCLACLAALSALALTGCHSHNESAHSADGHSEEVHAEGEAEKEADAHGHDANEIVFEPEQAAEAGVAVDTLRPGSFAEVVAVTGQVLPAQGSEATVTATMAGIVTLTNATLTDGAAVASGQALFSISARQMADGNPAAAAAAELEAARQDYERAKKLAADQLIAARELETARQRFETATATAQSLGNAKQTRSVAAPIGGYVKNVLVRSGDYVSAGQPLATVTQSRRLQLRAEVPERHYNILPRVESANFRLASGGNRTVYSLASLGGSLVSCGRAVDTDDFFVPVVFEFDNVGDIVPGSFAEVYLLGSPREGVLSLPVSALTEEQGLHFVYVRTSRHTYRKTEVQTGITDGARVEITHGLKAGDVVVTKGAIQVKLAASSSVVPEGHSH
ncbi:MAG: efflux RND transporter periplasmic adaptor subunit [Bacteroidales bacterium]|nr:efflux RND transporter periplasmic adaptor subunit [Bacteroidales bacterium]